MGSYYERPNDCAVGTDERTDERANERAVALQHVYRMGWSDARYSSRRIDANDD